MTFLLHFENFCLTKSKLSVSVLPVKTCKCLTKGENKMENAVNTKNTLSYIKPGLREEYKDLLKTIEGDSYFDYIMIMADKCLEKLSTGSQVNLVYNEIMKVLPFAKFKIVEIVEKFSPRGKEFKQYADSVAKNNAIEFPVSKSTGRR